jgi:peptidoglycan/LPS O-acetylase OafA/YrhL
LFGARFHGWAANFSYSTYLTHFPFVVFFGAVAAKGLGVRLEAPPSPLTLALLASAILLALAYAFAFSRLTEAHTSRMRDALGQILNRIFTPARLAATTGES